MPINIDGSKGIRQNTTEVTKIPVGTTAQRPANPEAGMIRFNTDQGFVEWYDDVGDRWLATSSFPGVAATGGTVTDITEDGVVFRVHTFTSDGTFDVTRGGEVEYLVVAAGGSSTVRPTNGVAHGGGGAGGYRTNVPGSVSGGLSDPEPVLKIASGTYPITVGQGVARDSGEDSVFHTITSQGGGGRDDRDGGSGGGAQGGNSRDDFGDGVAGQGFRGGTGASDQVAGSGGGGGGGAGAQGASLGTTNSGGAGGAGISSNITGSPVFRAGGGGGGGGDSGGSGGIGGGGNGTSNTSPQGGVPNTGGGGGSGWGNSDGVTTAAPAGGSGIVIVRYRIG